VRIPYRHRALDITAGDYPTWVGDPEPPALHHRPAATLVEWMSARGAIPSEGERGYRLWHELRMYACRPRR
jgi:hypothetical protein